MGVLKDVLCQLGVTTIIAKFLILDMPMDKEVPILTNVTTEEIDSEDDEDYCIKRNSLGEPIYGPKSLKYLNCNDPMDRALALQEEVLNNMGSTEEIENMLEMKVYEADSQEDIFSSKEWRREPCLNYPESYFTSATKDDHLWLVPKDDWTKGVGSQKDSMICCGQLITKMVKKMRVLIDKVLNSLSTPTYCRALDTTTLRELINSEGRLILEVPAPGVPRVAIPRGPRPYMHDLYHRMGSMEIYQGAIKRMAYR
ncbi:hypothetical protein Tco_1226941 [Tanacetum coccineum]